MSLNEAPGDHPPFCRHAETAENAQAAALPTPSLPAAPVDPLSLPGSPPSSLTMYGGPPPAITFWGGVGTVTGSKYLVETPAQHRVLLECGLFQGVKRLRLQNWDEPPFDPRSLDAVVLSHGHIDHAGYLPVLVRRGFGGVVHVTEGTADLLEVVLYDAARLQASDAEQANRHGYSKHHPALPLFDEGDVERALQLLRPHPYQQPAEILPGVTLLLRRAGHILGAATVELAMDVGGGQKEPRRLVFSGDLGRWNRPILRDPELVSESDVLLVESTYGDRHHPADGEDQLARIVRETVDRQGVLVVPAFSVGRTQELVFTLRRLEEQQRIPTVPVFIDSPMAHAVTNLYCRHPEDHDLEMTLLQDQQRCPLCSHRHHLVRTVDESKALNRRKGPMVIIAGSGMATGGRVLHHLKHRLPDPRNTVLLTGYQAEGTRGRALEEGTPYLKMLGLWVPVRARVERVDGLSAHADQAEVLRWLRGFRKPPRQTFVVHGESKAAQALATCIRTELGWSVSVAEPGQRASL